MVCIIDLLVPILRDARIDSVCTDACSVVYVPARGPDACRDNRGSRAQRWAPGRVAETGERWRRVAELGDTTTCHPSAVRRLICSQSDAGPLSALALVLDDVLPRRPGLDHHHDRVWRAPAW